MCYSVCCIDIEFSLLSTMPVCIYIFSIGHSCWLLMSTVNSNKHSSSMPSTDSSAGGQLTSASVDNYIGAFISQAADVALCLAKYTQLPSDVLIKEEQDEQVHVELSF
jgi:hypothetical protein